MIQGFFQSGVGEGRPIDAPFFCYRGGKARLRRFIVRWCRLNGSTYVEPFAGRANVFFLMRYLAQFKAYHLNDIQTIPFLRALLNYDGCKLPTLTKDEAVRLSCEGDGLAILLEPLIVWAGGLPSKSNFTGSRGHNLRTYREHLLLASQLLRGVNLTSEDALSVVDLYSEDPKAFLYIDPPYLGARLKEYNSLSVDLLGLWKKLSTAKCSWLYSESACHRISKHLGPPLACFFSVPINASPKSKVRYVREYLWSNYSWTPRRMDFGDRDRSIVSTSHSLIQSFGKLTFDAWKRVVPSTWSNATVLAQFNRLSCWPDYYFDGKSLSVCGGEVP
jgi:hypothetical protein